MHPMSHARKRNHYTTEYSIPEHSWKICMDVNMQDLSSPKKLLSSPFTLSHFTCLVGYSPYLLTSQQPRVLQPCLASTAPLVVSLNNVTAMPLS